MAYGKFSWENESDDILTRLKKIIKFQTLYPHNRVIDLSDCKALVAEIERLQAEVDRLKQYGAVDV